MAYDIGPKIGIDGEKEFREQLNNLNTTLRTTKQEMEAVSSSFDDNSSAQDRLKAKNQVLIKQIDQQSQKLKLLEKGLEESARKYGESDSKTQKWQATVYKARAELNNLQHELDGNERAIDAFNSEVAQSEKQMEKAGKSAKELKAEIDDLSGELKEKAASGLKAFAAGSVAAVTAAVALVESTKELREDLSKLKTNASEAGASFEDANNALLHFNAISGETDSSIEAISNLLKADFKGNNLAAAVESLSGAVIQFPDTLKIESLADSLQETLATSAATGQFGELLERLGYNLDDFNKGLQTCTTSADKQRYALKYLSQSGLREVNSEYVKNNKTIIEYSKSQLRLQEAMAAIGEKFAPLVTKGMNKISDAAEDFTDGPLKNLVDAGEWVVDNGEEVVSVLGGIGAALVTYKAIKGVTDIVGTFQQLHSAIKAATVAQEALNVAQMGSPIGLIAAGIAGVISAFAIYNATMQDTQTESAKVYEALKNNDQAIKDLNETLDASNKAREDNRIEVESEIVASRNLVTELGTLMEAENKTAVQKQRIKDLVAKLNELMPELNLSYDEQADKLNKSTQEIDSFVSAYEKKIKLQAAEEDLTIAINNQYEALKNAAKVQSDYTAAQEKVKKAQEAFNETLDENGKCLEGLQEKSYNLSGALTAARIEEERFKEQMDEANRLLEEADEAYAEAAAFANEYAEGVQTVSDVTAETATSQIVWKDTVVETSEEMAASFNALVEEYNAVYEAAEESIHSQLGLFDEIKAETSLTVDDMIKNLEQQATATNNWALNLQKAAKMGLDEGLLQELANAGIESAGYLNQIVTYGEDKIDELNAAWRDRFNAEKHAAEEMAGVSTKVDKEFANIKENTEKKIDELNKTWEEDYDIAGPAQKESESARKAVVKEFEFALTSVQNLEAGFRTSGANSAIGYANGLSSMRSLVNSAAANLAASALAAFNNRLDMHSPSKEFEKSGEFSGEGYVLGWEKKMADVGVRMADSIPKKFDVDGSYSMDTSGYGQTTGMDAYRMADYIGAAVARELANAGLTISFNKREFMRLVREG